MNKLQYFRVEFTESADPVGMAGQAVWSCAAGASKVKVIGNHSFYRIEI